MNRRMKVERGVITFVPVCSSVEDMHLHHLGGTRAAQEGSARFEETADPSTPPELHRDMLHRYHEWNEGPESRKSPFCFCLHRRRWSLGYGPCRRLSSAIVLEVAFNSTQPSTRHASGSSLHCPRIKAVRCDKNVDSVDTLEYTRSLVERDAQIHRPILTRRVSSSDLLRRG